jgi:hypothetical protein
MAKLYWEFFPQSLSGQEKSLAELNGTFESHLQILNIEAHDVLLNWENGNLKKHEFNLTRSSFHITKLTEAKSSLEGHMRLKYFMKKHNGHLQ